MKVEVLTTPDCINCKNLERLLDTFEIKYALVDVTEKPEYLQKYPIFTAPGLVVDGKLVFTGVPNKEKLKEIFQLDNVF
ncbi:MAG: thioredoxin family protein [Nitrosopumilaceae archaeon]|nr:thioredoxin family protein [Nitrosopumilaceae archaeon]